MMFDLEKPDYDKFSRRCYNNCSSMNKYLNNSFEKSNIFVKKYN